MAESKFYLAPFELQPTLSSKVFMIQGLSRIFLPVPCKKGRLKLKWSEIKFTFSRVTIIKDLCFVAIVFCQNGDFTTLLKFVQKIVPQSDRLSAGGGGGGGGNAQMRLSSLEVGLP